MRDGNTVASMTTCPQGKEMVPRHCKGLTDAKEGSDATGQGLSRKDPVLDTSPFGDSNVKWDRCL